MTRHRHDDRDARARLRFAVISSLLVSPPKRGELERAIKDLATRTWTDPVTKLPVRFGFSTIESWYYKARSASDDPIAALGDRVRSDRGRQSSVTEAIGDALRRQYEEHPSWSYTLHADNLAALANEREELRPLPSTSTLRRWMKANGLYRQRRRRVKDTEGAERASRRYRTREVRGYEASHVHALWHLDFHHGSRRVLLPEGRFAAAELLGILDDRSRLCCHGQWYLAETAEVLVHGLVQAILKRGKPRALMTDRGAAMRAAETQEGLGVQGIEWRPTLPYSPYQNGKQESWWSSIEGRLMPMLEGVEDLSLETLNEATQAWIEEDYNRGLHSELGCSPLERALAGPSVARDAPDPDALRAAFRRVVERRQRRSDGTLMLEGTRFEVPSRFGHQERVFVRYARWDLSRVELWDPTQRVVLARLFPQDKERNAEGLRRGREQASTAPHAPKRDGEIAPLLRQMIEHARERGLPPAYIPHPNPPNTKRER